MKNCSLALILVVLSFFGCDEEKSNFQIIYPMESSDEKSLEPKDTLKNQKENINELAEPNDSLDLLEVIGIARERIRSHQGIGNLKESFKLVPSQYAPDYFVEIEMGKLFESNSIHALVKIDMPGADYIFIYRKINKQLRLEFEDTVEYASFVNDTIFDVNRDGSKDYIIQTYPPSGCCLADGFHVSLRNSKSQLFEPSKMFLNATFDTKNRIVRGFDYDHPGEVELYKYRWRGMSLDTIEYIMHHPDKKGYYLQSKTPNNYRQGKATGRVLTKLPKEYHEIKGIGWFGIN